MPAGTSNSEEKKSTVRSGETVEELIKEKKVLEGRLKEKEEQLRKLKMVKMYRTKVCMNVMIQSYMYNRGHEDV